MVKGFHQPQRVRYRAARVGNAQGGGALMRRPGRGERMAARLYEAARVELHCPASAAHARSLILEDATVYADGWARWAEDGHVYVG
jgi:hypothetical protein